MKKITSKSISSNGKNQKNRNPFDDLSFWLTIATIDFGFLVNGKTKDLVSENNLPLITETDKKQT